jgi:hypothetical protein
MVLYPRRLSSSKLILHQNVSARVKLVRQLSKATPTSQSSVTLFSLKVARHTIHSMREEKRDWKFCVRVATLLRESVFVVGSCSNLGNWSSVGAVQLTSEIAPNNER